MPTATFRLTEMELPSVATPASDSVIARAESVMERELPILANDRIDKELPIVIAPNSEKDPPVRIRPPVDRQLPNRAALATDRALLHCAALPTRSDWRVVDPVTMRLTPADTVPPIVQVEPMLVGPAMDRMLLTIALPAVLADL